jgi:O-antigen/teichoic acid export membrane protein
MVSNSFYSLIAQLASGAFTAVITLYLARALAPSQYGDFALAVGVGTLVATPADFGVSSATARFVAEHRHDHGRLSAIVADGVRLKLIGSVLACGALAACAPLIADAYNAPLTWPLRIIALALFGQNLMFVCESSFIAYGQMQSYVRVAFGESAMECGATVVIVLLGGGVIGATAGRAIGYLFGALLALVLAARTFRWPGSMRLRGRPSLARRIARYAHPLMLVDGANALFVMIDVLLIGAYLGSRHVGLFSAPSRLLAPLFYPAIAVSNAVGPRMSRGAGKEPDGQALANGIRGLVLLYFLLMTPLVIWPRAIIHILLGSSYAESVPTMRLLSLTVLIGGLAPLVSVSVNYLGDASRRVPLMIGAVLLNAAIDVVLIPRVGIISGAIATAAAYAVMVGGHLRIASRHVVIPYRRLALSTLRAALAAAAMAGVLLLFGSNPSIPMLLIGGVAGSLVYAAVIFVLHEFSAREVRQARRRFARAPAARGRR